MQRGGYSLIEAIVAIGVLTIVIGTTISLTMSSTDSESANKDYFIATALANEGIQAVQDIYFTNLMKYGEDNAAYCGFLHTYAPANLGPTECVSYIIADNEEYRLERFTEETGTNWNLNNLQVAMLSGETNIDENFRLYFGEEFGYHTDPAYGNPSKFYRSISVKDAGGATVTMNYLIKSTVAWKTSGNRIRKYEISYNLNPGK